MKYKSIDEDLYLLKSNRQGAVIVYSPKKRKLFYATDISEEQIISTYVSVKTKGSIKSNLTENLEKIYLAKNVEISTSNVGMNGNRAVFLLTDNCNLACSYCYAHDGHKEGTLSKEQIQRVVDYIFDSDRDTNKHFTFIGGGEPFVNWELLKWSIEYIRRNSSKHKVYIGIQTNATLLTQEKIEWLKKYNVQVGCSFDILPEIQNEQRPFVSGTQKSFDVVDSAIKMLIANNIVPGIRSTITLGNCYKMPDMVSLVISRYPQIKQIHMEHVSSVNLTWDNYYSSFVNNFYKAKQLAASNGIYLKNSIVRSIMTLRNRFCSGELCIATNGGVMACHRVSYADDVLFNRFNYGNVTNKSVVIDINKLEIVNNLFEYKRKRECLTCFAKYHCAGQCCNNKNLYNENDFDELCKFTQEMILREFEYMMKL